MMRRRWVRITVIAGLILLPIIIGAVYRKSAHALYKRFVFPRELSVATGPDGGRYRPLSDRLVAEINRSDIGPRAVSRASDGSLENLRLLRDRRVDFALYQPGTSETLAPDEVESFDEITFVANLYSQPAHLIVRRGSGITTPADLKGRTVQLGMVDSGDYAMSLMLLEHFGLQESDLGARHLDYRETGEGFEDGSLDAAILTLGVQAPMLRRLFASGTCQLLPVPNREALTWKHVAMGEFTIPKGLYGDEPATDIGTVALGAQLLTHSEMSPGLVRELTAALMEERFLKQSGLRELFLRPSFARDRPGFSLHPGARSFYEEGFDIHIFEALDAMYSLVVSLGIAAIVIIRWWRNRMMRSKEHRLDRYMNELLEIEERQVKLDDSDEGRDAATLQDLLNEVTFLRQEALKELTAHDLNEDPAANSFLEMCHALSEKISAKISRQRMDAGIRRLTGVVERILERNQGA